MFRFGWEVPDGRILRVQERSSHRKRNVIRKITTKWNDIRTNFRKMCGNLLFAREIGV